MNVRIVTGTRISERRIYFLKVYYGSLLQAQSDYSQWQAKIWPKRFQEKYSEFLSIKNHFLQAAACLMQKSKQLVVQDEDWLQDTQELMQELHPQTEASEFHLANFLATWQILWFYISIHRICFTFFSRPRIAPLDLSHRHGNVHGCTVCQIELACRLRSSRWTSQGPQTSNLLQSSLDAPECTQLPSLSFLHSFTTLVFDVWSSAQQTTLLSAHQLPETSTIASTPPNWLRSW